MFIKNFKVKTSTAVRGSDRRKLRSEVHQSYPCLNEDDLLVLIPNKTEMTITKVTTHYGEMVVFYSVLGEPVFFETNKKLFPTVYTLWKYPGMVKLTFSTWPPVLKKLASGADLMLPGVILPLGGISSLQCFEKDETCLVMLKGNQAPVAVGLTTVSRKDIFEDGLRGKGVKILHVFTDFLWAHGSKTPLPQIGEVTEEDDDDEEKEEELIEKLEGTLLEVTEETNAAQVEKEDISETMLAPESDPDQLPADVQAESVTNESHCEGTVIKENEEGLKDDTSNGFSADELLEYCFYCAALRLKDQDLPVLTSTFYRNHMISYCPEGKSLDIKKSSHKKLSKFLQSMQEHGIIVIQELSKGVDSITAVNFSHDDLRSFKASQETWPPSTRTCSSQEKMLDQQGPIIEEMVSVSGATVNLFADVGYEKGTIFSCTEARKVITEYIKKHDLVVKTNQRLVLLDPVITKAVVNKNEDIASLSWDSLFTRLLNKMNSCYQVTLPGKSPVVRKGKIDLLEIAIEQRMGNKKVTLVRNLDVYGLDPQEFAHKIQLAAASSTSVSQLPGKNGGMQVLVQGNQVRIVASSLIDEYKIPKKFISGLELLKSSKKKK